MTKPTLYLFKSADSSAAAYTYDGIGLFACQPATAGVPIWCQAAWNDSLTSQVRLSRAVTTAIPALPRLVMRRVLFQYDPAKKAGTGYGPFDDSSHNPLSPYRQ